MSSIKELFDSTKTDKLLENSTGREIGASVESADYLKSNIKDKKRFMPHVDFTSASNFAIFGSAEKYYEDAYNYVLKEYPYDGSLREKINWSLSGTYLDRYIFENEYPRTTGYINFGESYGTLTQQTKGYDSSTKNEWIYFKGYNVDYSLNAGTNPQLTLQFDNLNIYNTASQGLSNLELEGSGGLGVEFWLNKKSFDSSIESRRQVVVDIWNSGSWGTADGVSSSYGRFRVEISGTEVGNKLHPNFHVELLSGSTGFSSEYVVKGSTPDNVPAIIMSGSTLTGSWNHFALTFQNTGSQMVGRLYTNGALTYTCVSGTTMGTVTGSMLGQVGSLVAKVSSSGPARGYGKLSGSLDEFRFWKTRRTATQIGRHWFTQVGGGTNTDLTLALTASTKYSYENPADLGVYYKFNEGILNTTQINPKDSVVIDYAGRVTNGEWQGYSVTSRNTGSAIVSASAASFEFADPILYSSHPLVSSSLADKKNIGLFYDVTNNSSMYGSLPDWITTDDQNNSNSALRNLTQIMASYFDTLYLQTQAVTSLKNKDYISGSDKPFPFVNRFINSSGFLTTEILSKATDLEYLDARNDKKLFVEKVNEIKNLIYKNIYNNLVYVYKTKGTEKSFRNLIRGFGVDKELINIKLYGDQITYSLLDNYDNATVRKRYVDFYSGSRVDAVVYQQTASGNTYSRGYISSSGEVQYRGNTYELETFFPKDRKKGTSVYFNAAFITASIYGCHTSGAAGSTAWGSPDYGQFQIRSVRPDSRRKAAYFQLTSSNDGAGTLPVLSSSVFQDVYDGTRWNFAVRIKPKRYPLAAGVSGSDLGNYDVEFSGYNYVLDILNNSFTVTASLAAADAQNFLKANKRFFIGAHRTNTTGTVLQQTNVKATSLRVWLDYLTSSVLQAHAKDVTNFGSANPYRDAYITELGAALGSKNVKHIPQLETLILNWNFDTLTGSDANGNFTVPDVSIASSGTNDYTGRWGWLGPIGQYQHTGYGFGFPTSDTGSIDRRYVHTLILQTPENVNSSNMVSLIDEDQNKLFTKDSRPENYFFAFEKSMYDIVSKEIIDIFGTIVDFNNLIGEPVNRYRQEYKQMQKLRQLYFERVQNTIDLDKFVEYFKWLDSAIAVMLQQLVPAGAKFSENLRTMVESHVLERNKYWTKFPTLEMKISDPEAGLYGITEMLYSGKRGIAPIPTTATGSNCEWWYERAKRSNSNITSGDSIIDTQRGNFRRADDFRSGSGPTLAVSRKTTATTTTYEAQAYALRNFTRILRLNINNPRQIHGGSNFDNNKKVDYFQAAINSTQSADNKLYMGPTRYFNKFCSDVIVPEQKKKMGFRLTHSVKSSPLGYEDVNGSLLARFSMYSASTDSGFSDPYIIQGTSILKIGTPKSIITNYHDDSYGNDAEIPIQGPFTDAHVGGRQSRHQNINTGATDTTLTRAEAWNANYGVDTNWWYPRNSEQPAARYMRDAYAKRSLNIRNIKWGTSSVIAGNYRKDYQMIQTSGRTLNNRFFVDNEGFSPSVVVSPYVSGIVDFTLPRYDLTGTNQFIFVERFSAPGGPEVNSRGNLDIYAEEYSVYNSLNYRNLVVRNALKEWQTEHCGQFGIQSVSGSLFGYRQPYTQNYDTLASYHKTPRNAAHRGFYSSGNDREVEWATVADCSLSNYNRTLTGLSSTGWSSHAKSNQIVETTGYLEVEVADISSKDWAIGISSGGDHFGGSRFWNFSLYHPGSGVIRVYEGDQLVATFSATVAVGDKIRIFRDKSTVFYQYKAVNSNNWVDEYVSATIPKGNYYPRAAFLGASVAIKNPRISNPRYDNWFIQHPIPQSALQYAWINDSYDAGKDQPLGYTGGSHDNGGLIPYSVPITGTATVPKVNATSTSTTASAVQFISSSCFDPDWDPACAEVVNFAQYWTINPTYNQSRYHYTVTGSTNTLRAASWWSTVFGQSINAFFNNINGPYQYPLWKQIRTGETPVARYHKRNNILSIMSPFNIQRDQFSGDVRFGERSFGRRGFYFNTRKDTFTNFVEPPVTFRYRPLTNAMDSVPPERAMGRGLGGDVGRSAETGEAMGAAMSSVTPIVALKSTYSNNKCLWSEGIAAGYGPVTRSIADYLYVDNETGGKQIYDKMVENSDIRQAIRSLSYKEVVYPRGMNAGLAKVRGRTQYAEVASGSLRYNGTTLTFSASLSNGTNGIDRQVASSSTGLGRRTFWRDADYYRNRRAGWEVLANSYAQANYNISGTLLNSQGFTQGQATSVLGVGQTPISYILTSLGTPASGSGLALSSSNESPNDFPDTGELNSANLQFFSAFAGTAAWSNINSLTSSFTSHLTWYPTASAQYCHLPKIGPWNGRRSNYMAPLKWRAAVLSGKKPWFDSYEDYAEDIRGNAKNFTIIPEFRMSEHLNYYIKENSGDFTVQNDKFLNLNGANITASADAERQSEANGNPIIGKRVFREKFFNDYSNSDFQKYFGKFYPDESQPDPQAPNKITLRCRGIKKLLPYNGFYPQQRTLQLASMFSQSLAPKISGISLIEGTPRTDGINVDSRQSSGALAVQSLLQPFYAPGILYNTIKSGIAVSWGAYTGSMWEAASTANGSTGGSPFINQPPTLIVPFESLLDPLNQPGIPKQDVTTPTDSRLYLALPTYMTGTFRDTQGIEGQAFSWDASRKPYVILTGSARTDAGNEEGPYGLYKLAMNNFLAEIPNFFLNNGPDGQFKKIVSPLDASHLKTNLVNGVRYFMDIYLKKSSALEMITDTPRDADRDVKGRFFGPPLAPRTDVSALHYQTDPSYAPYTPPYFYGDAKIQIEYVAASDESTNFSFGRFFNNLTASYINAGLDNLFNSTANATDSPAGVGRMHLSESINIKGVFRERGNPADTSTDTGLDKWVLSPKMETPVLDFSDNTLEFHHPGGMWGGYGKMPKDKSISFGITRTHTGPTADNTGSLIKVMFDDKVPDSQTIGEMAQNKEISEAIVAIPYLPDQPGAGAPLTEKPILGRWFFTLGGQSVVKVEEQPRKPKWHSWNIFSRIRKSWLEHDMAISQEAITNGWPATYGVTQPVSTNSISELAQLMNTYMLPPELDFNIYDGGDPGESREPDANFIEPFVMYILEFRHKLGRQDLIDIWQGLMPKISTTAEEDISQLSYPNAPLEFFGGNTLPPDIRWMVFKVKKRANLDYYAATPSITDDPDRKQTVGPNFASKEDRILYGYNWPYDYFSLVELAELEVAENEFEEEQPVLPPTPAVRPTVAGGLPTMMRRPIGGGGKPPRK